MYSIFQKSVANHQHETAVILSSKDKISFKELNEDVELWAKYLYAIGIQQGDRVGLILKNEDLHLVLYLALDKLNATTIPFDETTPPAQLTCDFALLNLKKILTDQLDDGNFNIPEHLQHVLTINGYIPQHSNVFRSIELPEINRNANIPTYIVASSGVTADKKWIPINNIEGFKYWLKTENQLLQLKPKDKVLCTRSPAYDARFSEYLRSLGSGSTLVLLKSTERKDFDAIIACCESEHISCIILIASQLSTPALEPIIKKLASFQLKHLLVTGDVCSVSLKLLCEKYTINLWNCYGPTEATFGMSMLRVNNEHCIDNNGNLVVPIGLPSGNEITCHLAENGCLYIESDFLSPGYYNNPEMTAKNFPIMRFDNRDVRVFNTENKFFLKDNRLLFMGRIDKQSHCKVSGVKVDPNAIQHCLDNYNQHNEQVLFQSYVVIKSWLNNQKPFAYLVIQNDFSKTDFKNYLKNWLRKEELPIIIVLREFPRLIPSDKIDRKALITRQDHPDEFFFNEGFKNHITFANSGKGLNDNTADEINHLQQYIEQNSHFIEFGPQMIDYSNKLVLAANHLDQSLVIGAHPPLRFLICLAAPISFIKKAIPILTRC